MVIDTVSMTLARLVRALRLAVIGYAAGTGFRTDIAFASGGDGRYRRRAGRDVSRRRRTPQRAIADRMRRGARARHGYYIFTPPHQVDFPPVKAFRDWLVKEATRSE